MTSFAIQTFLCCAYLKFYKLTTKASWAVRQGRQLFHQNLVIFILFVTLLTVLIAIAYEYTVGFSFVSDTKAGDEFFHEPARHNSSG